MKKLLQSLASFALVVLAADVAQGVRAQARQSGGAYTMYMGEQAAATESYVMTIEPSGARRSEAEVAFGPSRSKVVTTVGADGRPLSFTVEAGGVRALATEFGAGMAKLTAAGKEPREVKTEASVILENAVWHHFIYLLARYDAARGGRQSFVAFLPSQATDFTLQLERVGSEAYAAGGRQVVAEHFRVVTAFGLTLDLWADAERVPLFMRIASQGVRVVRAGSEALAEALTPKPPPSTASANDPFASEEVTFQNGDVKLAGTLTLPKKGSAPYPAAVLITGSGGQDRDGSTIFNIYRRIAERLSAEGVAVLRVDDRGTGKSTLPRIKLVSYTDLVNDTRAAFNYLLTRADVDKARVALVGHSEGAETALMIASDDRRVAAVALLAGTSRPTDRVVYEQALYMVALRETVDPSDPMKLPQVSRELMKIFDAAKSEPKPASAEEDKYAWFREHAATDPSSLARRVSVPVLLLNGERDTQVLPSHALELARALGEGGNRRVRLRILPNLTHLFTPSTLDKGVSEEKATEVSTDFLQALQTWMTETLVATKAVARP